MIKEQEYVALRNKYVPSNIKVVFILESPPSGHGYFYNPNGKVSEILFRAFMQLLGYVAANKEEGLKTLADRGFILVNPVHIPVNKLPDKEADAIIVNNYKNFLADLDSLIKENRNTPIILVKANILRLLEKPMVADGYNILNKGVLVPFPLHYHINSFLQRVKSMLPN